MSSGITMMIFGRLGGAALAGCGEKQQVQMHPIIRNLAVMNLAFFAIATLSASLKPHALLLGNTDSNSIRVMCGGLQIRLNDMVQKVAEAGVEPARGLPPNGF